MRVFKSEPGSGKVLQEMGPKTLPLKGRKKIKEFFKIFKTKSLNAWQKRRFIFRKLSYHTIKKRALEKHLLSATSRHSAPKPSDEYYDS